MFTTYRRHSLVIALAIVAGFTSMLVRPQAQVTPVLPSMGSLTAGTGWHVAGFTPVGRWTGMVYDEWWLRNQTGATVVLYLGVTNQVQKMVRWTGELGYQGAGYLASDHRLSTVRLADGTVAPVSTVLVHSATDRQVVEYAVVNHNGIVARATDDILHTAWDTLRGQPGLYYEVRVSVPQSGGAAAVHAAESLLSTMLPVIRADARAH